MAAYLWIFAVIFSNRNIIFRNIWNVQENITKLSFNITKLNQLIEQYYEMEEADDCEAQ